MLQSSRMYVVKRSGKTEPVYFDKITKRNEKLCRDLNIDPIEISQKVIQSIHSGIKTEELDNLSAETALYLSTYEPDYEIFAKRLVISNSHKTIDSSFYTSTKNLYDMGLLDENYASFVFENREILDNMIQHDRDYDMTYFGFKTLEKSYLTRDHKNNIIERVQHLFMRTSVFLHFPNLDKIKNTYDLMSQKYFIHASPTLFNSGLKCPQLASCFLLSMEDDLENMLNVLTKAGMISKFSGGIGINVSMIRSKGSYIGSTGGKSDGVVPYLKVWNSLARYVNQCFTPDTWVYSKNGPKQMKNVTEEDYLITIDRSFKKVNQVIVNNVDKEILEVNIANSLLPVKLTKEHEIYLIKNKDQNINKDTRHKLHYGIIKPEFRPASEMEVNDIVGFPFPKYVCDDPTYDMDFCKFYGMMLSNGSIDDCTDNMVEYELERFGKKELRYKLTTYNLDTYDFVINFLTSHNITFSRVRGANNNCKSTFVWFDTNLCLSRNMLYSDDKITKKMFEPFLHLPVDKIIKIIEGIMGLASFNETDPFQYSTESLELINQVKYILLRLGIYTDEFISTEDGKEVYNIILFDQNENPNYFEYNGFIWRKINSIKTIHYKGEVYDFNMIDNHNYLTCDMGLVHNSGRRKGAVAVYFEPHHADIMDFIKIRKNNTKEESRCPDLHIGLWISDLFMKRVKEGKMWSLFDPSKLKKNGINLHDSYGTEYEELYTKAEEMKLYEEQIKAQDLWREILFSHMETGEPYMLFKDHINNRSNQKNIGVIRGSNLCTEITEYTDKDTISVCNLCSVSLPAFVNKEDETFDYAKLGEVIETITENLNLVIDKNYYPIIDAKISNLLNRPIGVGASGLADVFQMLGLSWEDKEARELNTNIYATIYFHSLKKSVEMAKQTGYYENFPESPFSKGILQQDLAKLFPGQIEHTAPITIQLDWDGLRNDIMKFGTRNSLLTTQMPTASTAQIIGNNESMEPYTSNMYARSVLSGTFPVINNHLYNDLKKLNMWNIDIVNDIIRNNGSIQEIPSIPDRLKSIYKTSWELKAKIMVDFALDRGEYIDQSQSFNVFMETPTIGDLSSMFMYSWSRGMKTGMYYLRRKPQVQAIKFTVPEKEVTKKVVGNKTFVCTDEVCTSCSS